MIKVGLAAATGNLQLAIGGTQFAIPPMAESCFMQECSNDENYLWIKKVSADIPMNRNYCIAHNLSLIHI